MNIVARTTRWPLLCGALALSVLGCTEGFLETHPPILRSYETRFEVDRRDVPVVYLVLFNLTLAAPQDCAAVQADLLAQLEQSFTPVGGALAYSQDLTGGTCAFNASAEVDWTALTAAMDVVEAQHDVQDLRPIVVYLQSADEPRPGTLSLGPAERWQTHAPLLWAISPRGDGAFHWWAPWTDLTNPDLLYPLAAEVMKQLPLIKEGTPPEGHPLLTPAELEGVEMLKMCNAEPTLLNVVLGGIAFPADPALPPSVVYNVGAVPLPRSHFAAPPLWKNYRIELCLGDCNGYYDRGGHYERWAGTEGCFLLTYP